MIVVTDLYKRRTARSWTTKETPVERDGTANGLGKPHRSLLRTDDTFLLRPTLSSYHGPGLEGGCLWSGLVGARSTTWEEEASDARGGDKRSRIGGSIENQGETCTDYSVKQMGTSNTDSE